MSDVKNLLAILAMLALPLGLAQAQSATQQAPYLIGQDSERATRALKDSGFTFSDSRNDEFDNRHTYWRQGRSGACLHVVSYRGEITRVADASRTECGGQYGGGGSADVHAISMLGIIGQSSRQATRTIEDRGFQFATSHDDTYRNRHTYWWSSAGRNCLHVVSYDGRITRVEDASSSECGKGSVGYNTANYYGGGQIEYDDLAGMRMSSGMDAMQQRGFRQVDNFTSGNTRYSIQWSDRTRQCVQITMADGRFVDLRDIGQHPRCR